MQIKRYDIQSKPTKYTEFWVCAVKMNSAFDRFTRIQPPTLIKEYAKVVDNSRGYTRSNYKLIPHKGRTFNLSSDLQYFDNYDECVKHFNSMIDSGTSQYKNKLTQMAETLRVMQSKKIKIK